MSRTADDIIYIRNANINDNKQMQCASQKFLYTCEMMFTTYDNLKAFQRNYQKI